LIKKKKEWFLSGQHFEKERIYKQTGAQKMKTTLNLCQCMQCSHTCGIVRKMRTLAKNPQVCGISCGFWSKNRILGHLRNSAFCSAFCPIFSQFWWIFL